MNLTNVMNVDSSFKEASVDWGIPRQSSYVYLSNESLYNGYTAPCSGVVILYGYSKKSGIELKVNGYIAGYIGYTSGDMFSSTLISFVGKGQTITVSNREINNYNAKFIPLKGVSE